MGSTAQHLGEEKERHQQSRGTVLTCTQPPASALAVDRGHAALSTCGERLQSKHRETDAWESVIHLLGHPGHLAQWKLPFRPGQPSSFRIRQTHADVAFARNEASQSQLAPTPSPHLSLLSPATHSCSRSASARGSSGCLLSCVHSSNALPAGRRLTGHDGAFMLLC